MTSATMNGYVIEADKDGLTIANHRVTFNDGSWVSTTTGEGENRGPGRLTVNGKDVTTVPAGAPPMRGLREQTFLQLKHIRLQNIAADVIVNITTSVATSQLRVEGDQDTLDAMDLKAKDGVLVLGPAQAQQSSYMNVSARGSNVVIGGSGNSISVNGSNISIGNAVSEDAPLKLLFTVPPGVAVDTVNVHGHVNIGDIAAPLTVTSMGGQHVHAGAITSLQAIVQGSGCLDIDRVDGNVSVAQQGSGDVSIAGGNIDVLTAQTMGSGDLTVAGNVVSASLTTMGSGDIILDRCDGEPLVTSLGNGKVIVRNRL